MWLAPDDSSSASASTSGLATTEKWTYQGKVNLIDLEVVVSRSPANSEAEADLDRRLEILSPEHSFAAYALSESARDEWASVIRGAKASLLVSLNVMHPHSTLTSSVATTHLRTRLIAAAYDPMEEGDEEGIKDIEGKTVAVAWASDDITRKAKPRATNGDERPMRGMVDHFVPAIWVPDGKTDVCMRCSRVFSWRRRRHHCRLCGRCVCAKCSDRVSQRRQ